MRNRLLLQRHTYCIKPLADLLEALNALFSRFFGTLSYQTADAGGYPPLFQRIDVDRFLKNLEKDLIDGISGVRLRARQQLEQQNPEGIYIHKLGDFFSSHLLRSHVIWRSQCKAVAS